MLITFPETERPTAQFPSPLHRVTLDGIDELSDEQQSDHVKEFIRRRPVVASRDDVQRVWQSVLGEN